MNLDLLIRVSISLFPVVLFLIALVFIDSYKLVPVRGLLMALFVGAAVALICLSINDSLRSAGISRIVVARYWAPPVEEIIKVLYVFWLIRNARVGFMVDAAIVGFAVGAGFALIENTYYLKTLQTSGYFVWIVRGLGTAVMHGGMTALAAIIAKQLFDRWNGRGPWYLPGIVAATVLHSAYNHFVLPPITTTIVLHLTLPALLIIVFWQSERSTRQWLGSRMDADAELLELIQSGRMSESRLGKYVSAIQKKFAPEMVIDILCYLRLRVELAISAKGHLMMRAAGFKQPLPDGTEEKFRELKHLEKAIGPTGRRAIAPVLKTSTQDLWQMYHLSS